MKIDSSFRTAKRAISQPTLGKIFPLERSTSLGPPSSPPNVPQSAPPIKNTATEKLWRLTRCRSFFDSLHWFTCVRNVFHQFLFPIDAISIGKKGEKVREKKPEAAKNSHFFVEPYVIIVNNYVNHIENYMLYHCA